MSLAIPVLRYGKDEPLPERIPLRAGPLSLVYENGDIRTIRLGGHEILRRVYVAIRDHNWGTVLPVFSNVEMDIGDDAFKITYDVENAEGDIDFCLAGKHHWRCRWHDSDGDGWRSSHHISSRSHRLLRAASHGFGRSALPSFAR